MATSQLLRLLSRRVLPSVAVAAGAAFAYGCLSGNVEKPWVTYPLGENLTSFASRQFSSKSAGSDLFTENGSKPSTFIKISYNDYYQYMIVEAPEGDAWVVLNIEDALTEFLTVPLPQYTLSQIVLYFFSTFKNIVDSSFEETVSKAIVIVPSYFNEAQRHSAEDAAKVAGFEVLRVITDDPAEDAFPYGIKEKECHSIAVLDISGGTFDLHIQNTTTAQVLSIPTKAFFESIQSDDFSYKIVKAPDGNARVEFNSVPMLQFSISQICPFVFTWLKNSWESSSGRKLSKAVLIVPSYFNEAQRHATIKAATVAGLDVLRVFADEPSVDTFLKEMKDKPERGWVAVLNLTGRVAFDLKIWKLISGNTMTNYVVDELKRVHGYDITKDPSAFQRFNEAVDRAFEEYKSSPTSHTNGFKIKVPVADGEPVKKKIIIKFTKTSDV